MQLPCIALLAFAHAALASIFPVPDQLNNADKKVATTIDHRGNAINAITGMTTIVDARRRAYRKKARRSTSSSSGERYLEKDRDGMDQRSTSSFSRERIIGNAQSAGDSIGIKSSGESDESSDDKQRKPLEGGGWRKWHRKCTPCPQDMAKKWRDPTISWICGGYQRARRSFKSECMMYYRNCQDGTMFVKLTDHRCDDTAPGYNGGRHFFYEYQVKLPDDTSGKSTETDATSEDDSDDTYEYRKNSEQFE